jgi:hypothetical protein
VLVAVAAIVVLPAAAAVEVITGTVVAPIATDIYKLLFTHERNT